jgi:hypothetical protein
MAVLFIYSGYRRREWEAGIKRRKEAPEKNSKIN